jgi:hypothetical protein
MRTPHPHIRLLQIVVQRRFLKPPGDRLLEKWYAFCDSPLFKNCNPEVGHGFDVRRIGLRRLARLRLSLSRPLRLHQANALDIQLLRADSPA